MSLAELVAALYAELGTWQAVADLCQHGFKRRHSAGYYQQVASGRITKPSARTLAGIARAPELAERLLKCDFSKSTRFGLTVERSIGEKLRSVKNARGWTWDETLLEAAELMEGER